MSLIPKLHIVSMHCLRVHLSWSVGLVEGGNLLFPDSVFPRGETSFKGTLRSFPWVGTLGGKNWICVLQPLLLICILRAKSAFCSVSASYRCEGRCRKGRGGLVEACGSPVLPVLGGYVCLILELTFRNFTCTQTNYIF